MEMLRTPSRNVHIQQIFQFTISKMKKRLSTELTAETIRGLTDLCCQQPCFHLPLSQLKFIRYCWFNSSPIHVQSEPPSLSPAPYTLLESRQNNISSKRERGRKEQLSRPERMVKGIRVELEAGGIEDNVAAPMPLVDNGRVIPGQFACNHRQ